MLRTVACTVLFIGWLPALAQQAAPTLPEGPAPAQPAIERGNLIYRDSCAVCHGANGSGGNGAKIDLRQSPIAMANDGGRQLAALLQTGRLEAGMPARPVTEAEAADLWAKLRSFAFRTASGPAATEPVLVGDAAAGKAFFSGTVGRCDTCHAVTPGASSSAANLAAIGSKYPDPKRLQQAMLLGERRYYWSPSNSRDVTATISYRDGRVITGYLTSVSDFKVIVRDAAGVETILARRNGEPRVVLTDRMQHHLDLLPRYRDNDIHDLTAYLATLK